MEEEVKDPQAVLAELRRAQEDLRALRAENKELKKQAESTDHEAWKERAVRAEAKLALADHGIKDADRVMKYLDLNGLDFDEEGNMTGLDEKLEQVKADLPELFDVKRRVGGKGDIFADSGEGKVPTASERQAAALLGRA